MCAELLTTDRVRLRRLSSDILCQHERRASNRRLGLVSCQRTSWSPQNSSISVTSHVISACSTKSRRSAKLHTTVLFGQKLWSDVCKSTSNSSVNHDACRTELPKSMSLTALSLQGRCDLRHS